jgi:UDP-N-acetylglucosamine:LPS N-acetylglucosamine transferase
MSQKILAVASGGGHWVQLLRLRPAFVGCRVTYVTVQPSYAEQVSGERFHAVCDATRWDRLKLIRMALQILWILVKERPDMVISTGAAPGVVALRLGKWVGARTVWLDSIANVEALSMSGRKAKKFADLTLSQWPDVAKQEGCEFKGAVL